MKSRIGYAVVRKTGILQHWPDQKFREQFDVFVDKLSAQFALEEWDENTGDQHKIVKVRISQAND